MVLGFCFHAPLENWGRGTAAISLPPAPLCTRCSPRLSAGHVITDTRPQYWGGQCPGRRKGWGKGRWSLCPARSLAGPQRCAPAHLKPAPGALGSEGGISPAVSTPRGLAVMLILISILPAPAHTAILQGTGVS